MTEDFKAIIQHSLRLCIEQAKSIGVTYFNSFYFDGSDSICIEIIANENKRKNAVFGINKLTIKEAAVFTSEERRLIRTIISVYLEVFNYQNPHYVTCYFAGQCAALSNEYYCADSADQIDIYALATEE